MDSLQDRINQLAGEVAAKENDILELKYVVEEKIIDLDEDIKNSMENYLINQNKILDEKYGPISVYSPEDDETYPLTEDDHDISSEESDRNSHLIDMIGLTARDDAWVENSSLRTQALYTDFILWFMKTIVWNGQDLMGIRHHHMSYSLFKQIIKLSFMAVILLYVMSMFISLPVVYISMALMTVALIPYIYKYKIFKILGLIAAIVVGCMVAFTVLTYIGLSQCL